MKKQKRLLAFDLSASTSAPCSDAFDGARLEYPSCIALTTP